MRARGRLAKSDSSGVHVWNFPVTPASSDVIAIWNAIQRSNLHTAECTVARTLGKNINDYQVGFESILKIAGTAETNQNKKSSQNGRLSI